MFVTRTVVVCVDCVSAGATAYQAFWRRFLGRYGEYGDVDIGGGSIPKRGSPRFITRVVGAYVAQIVCYEIGRQIGAGFGTAIAMNLSLEATGAVGGLIYLIAAVVGVFVLLKTSAERGTRLTKRDWAAASPFFAAAAALILASISLHKVVTLERVQRKGSKKKEYDSVADEWVHQRVTESESDDDSVEAPTVRTPLQ